MVETTARRFALLAAVALVIGAGVAYATGGMGSWVAADGTIAACVKKNGQVTLVKSGERCGNNETRVQWNAEGPRGATGAQGPAGPRGATGDRGPTGAAGATGATGPTGADGQDGEDGADGADGATGATGPRGADGAPGTASLAALQGTPCVRADGSAGTVNVSVTGTNSISFTCAGGGGPVDPDFCAGSQPTYPNAITTCDEATDSLSIICLPGFFDANGDIADGCEVTAEGTPEVCNNLDDDGDGLIDEENPGGGPRPNGSLECTAGNLVLNCNSGFADANGDPDDGCESAIDTDPTGNTQATATNIGVVSNCDTDVRNLSGLTTSANDHDWYRLTVDDQFFCVDDLDFMFGAGPGIGYSVITPSGTFGPFTGPFANSSVSFSDGATIFIHVRPLGSTVTPSSWSMQFHF